MSALEPMLRATTLLSAVGLITAAIAGVGSAGLAAGAVLAVLNLFALSALVRRFAGSMVAGAPPALGLAVLNGKVLMLPIAMIVVGQGVGFAQVVLGYALVATAFTLAVPTVAVFTSSPRLVESL